MAKLLCRRFFVQSANVILWPAIILYNSSMLAKLLKPRAGKAILKVDARRGGVFRHTPLEGSIAALTAAELLHPLREIITTLERDLVFISHGPRPSVTRSLVYVCWLRPVF